MRKVLFAFSALVVLATSCKKDKDDDGPVTPTKENLVGSYKVTKVQAGSGTQFMDITSQDWAEACEKDDLHKLNADNTYQWVDAGVKCDPSEDYTDTWSLTNSTTLVIDGETLTIRSFDGKNLEVSYLEPFTTLTYITTYQKQ